MEADTGTDLSVCSKSLLESEESDQEDQMVRQI